MTLALGLLTALLGACVGSFLNVCIDRLPAGESVLTPPSHCDRCGHRLKPQELIPLASYLALRGRCKACRGAISPRVPMVEALTAVIFALAWRQYGASLQTGLTWLFAAFLIAIAFVDLEHQLILNRLSYPAIALAAATALLRPPRPALSLFAGGIVGFGLLLAIAALHREGMGLGDVKLAAFVGLAVGFPTIFLTLLFAFIAGGLAASALMLAGTLRRKDPIAFGPYLALAAIVTLLYGEPLLGWWLGRI